MTIHFQRELDKLKKQVLELTALVEQDVRKAVESVNNLNGDLAEEVINSDVDIDKKELDIEEECLKILALHQPVAIDLRYVIACLKMNNDLERIGDLSVNIAERAMAINRMQSGETTPLDFLPMTEKTQSMLQRSLEALITMDADMALEVCADDDEVDEYNREMYAKIAVYIKEKPEKTEYYLNLLSISRQLERIADYATNIAEDIIYMVNGNIVRHQDELTRRRLENGKSTNTGS